MSSENWADKLRNFEKEVEKKNEAERNAKLTERLKQEKRIRYESEKSLELLKDLGVEEMLQGVRCLWGVGVVTSFKFDPEKMENLSSGDFGWAEYGLSYGYPYYSPAHKLEDDGADEFFCRHYDGLGIGISYETILNYVNGNSTPGKSLEGIFVQNILCSSSDYTIIPLSGKVNQDLERFLIEDTYERKEKGCLPVDKIKRETSILEKMNRSSDVSGIEVLNDFIRKGTPSYPLKYGWKPPSDRDLKNRRVEIWQPK